MIFMTTTVFKKMSLLTLGLACAAGVIFSVGAKTAKPETNVEAATILTKRVWVNTNEYPSYWYDGGAVTGIHYWGASEDYVKVILDSANSTWYYDIPNAVNDFQLLRIGTSGEHWSLLSNQVYGIGTFWLHTDGSVGYDGGTHITTTIVTNFIATTSGICSKSAAQTIIDNYNLLATFEQDQFDVYDVGEGVTGLQRLNFLKTKYTITTDLNVSNIGTNDESNSSSLFIMSIIGIVGLSTLGAYYSISRKRRLN